MTWPFAVPGLAGHNLQLLAQLHQWLGWGDALPPFAPLHLLFANLMGCVVVAWSLLRVWSAQARFGLVDGCTRMAFSACFTWYLWAADAAWVLFCFLCRRCCGVLPSSPGTVAVTIEYCVSIQEHENL